MDAETEIKDTVKASHIGYVASTASSSIVGYELFIKERKKDINIRFKQEI